MIRDFRDGRGGLARNQSGKESGIPRWLLSDFSAMTFSAGPK